MSSQSTNLSQLFTGALQTGALTQAGFQALQVTDLGAQIQNGLGIHVDDVTTSEVTLLSQLIDDSGSIGFVAGNTEAVRDGHNAVLDALSSSKQANGILAHCRYLNGQVLYPYRLLKQAVRMTRANYSPGGGTPLYDQTGVLLGTAVAKVQEFEDNNVPARSILLIITDGDDQGSCRHKPRTLRPLVEDLLRTEMHIIAGMGIFDGSTDFRKIFRSMGIQDNWILTPANDPKEIRAAFRLFSQSALRASQGGASFSQTAAGGFGSP